MLNKFLETLKSENTRKTYERAIRQYQTVLWTHTADMITSKVRGV